jgi:hypothetical protein
MKMGREVTEFVRPYVRGRKCLLREARRRPLFDSGSGLGLDEVRGNERPRGDYGVLLCLQPCGNK